MPVRFSWDSSAVDRLLENMGDGDLSAVVINVARSEEGYYYWDTVNDGRGPVRPVKASVLHWVDRNGKDVFARYAGPAAPQHLRENSIATIKVKAQALTAQVTTLDRASVAKLLNAIAQLAVDELKARKPEAVNLNEGYVIKRAV